MKQLTALLWKEWFEVRALFAIGLFVFVGLPLIGAVEFRLQYHRFDFDPSPWVVILGGVLAVFVAVGVVVRDVNGKLEEFWRSRPVSVVRWLLVKYVVGLSVVLTTLTLPLVVQIASSSHDYYGNRETWTILMWHPPLWAALYSLSFAIACLIRRGAHATMLSIAVSLLLYFLPEIIPPIHFLSLIGVMEQYELPPMSSALAYILGMLALCVIGLQLALTAVRRDWRIESDRKMIYWSIGAALLVLFSSAAFQVASNLPLLAKVDRPTNEPANERVLALRSDGTQGIMVTERKGPTWSWTLHSFRLTPSGVELGPATDIKQYFYWDYCLWRPERPDVIYIPGVRSDPSSNAEDQIRSTYPILTILSLHDGIAQTDTLNFPDLATKEPWGAGKLYAWRDRLYMTSAAMTFDISDPLKPRLITREPEPDSVEQAPSQQNPERSRLNDYVEYDEEVAVFPLPHVPGLPPRQRLELAASSWKTWMRLDGDILVRSYDSITTYRLDQLTDTSARFRKLGRYDLSPVERLFGTSWGGHSGTADGLFFSAKDNGLSGSTGVRVFDITGSHPRPVGHYAFIGENGSADLALCPLPDGRLLAATSNHLYLLGPPPGHK